MAMLQENIGPELSSLISSAAATSSGVSSSNAADASKRSNARSSSSSSRDNGIRVSCRLTMDPNLDSFTCSNRSRICSAPRWISAGSLSSASALLVISSVADHGITRKIASGSSSRAPEIAWPRSLASD